MNIRSISVFLPTRKGSQRVKNKNTRPFASFEGGLLELKLKQLIDLKSVGEIVLSTNDEKCIEIAKKISIHSNKINIVPRPDSLALDTTKLTDLISYVPTICQGEHILWTHVTSPFTESTAYDNAVKLYFESLSDGFDSLMSVRQFKNFLWSNEKRDIINRTNNELRWPRTQDLAELYEIDSAIFLTNRDTYIKKHDRIGINPILFCQKEIQSFDIDWEDDFVIAEAIYESINARQHDKF